MIEFREIDNVSRILYTHSVRPHSVIGIYPVSPSVLVYFCIATRQLHWLDCSGKEPKNLGITVSLDEFHTYSHITDMSAVNHEGETLLVVLQGCRDGKIYVFSAATGRLKWSAEIKLPSTGQGQGKGFEAGCVTADG